MGTPLPATNLYLPHTPAINLYLPHTPAMNLYLPHTPAMNLYLPHTPAMNLYLPQTPRCTVVLLLSHPPSPFLHTPPTIELNMLLGRPLFPSFPQQVVTPDLHGLVAALLAEHPPRLSPPLQVLALHVVTPELNMPVELLLQPTAAPPSPYPPCRSCPSNPLPPPVFKVRPAGSDAQAQHTAACTALLLQTPLPCLLGPPPPFQVGSAAPQQRALAGPKEVGQAVQGWKNPPYSLSANPSTEGAMRRRVLAGLKEVGQAVRSGRAKCVVLAPNVEEVFGAGDVRRGGGRGKGWAGDRGRVVRVLM
ncbi:unnamed protein product [Closterium sp. Naga37s-1]|nr:unnamed protein product [Closterium sp. Naga37s-1]